ncbi:hypothetical protein VP277E431_P0153 [Vibrio phage 277E43-1]|nr:hypothetical protein VP277E431_P0153 [Vibrio phage 277E43-1]
MLGGSSVCKLNILTHIVKVCKFTFELLPFRKASLIVSTFNNALIPRINI